VTVAGELAALKDVVAQLNQLDIAVKVVRSMIWMFVAAQAIAAVAAGLAFRAVNPADR